MKLFFKSILFLFFGMFLILASCAKKSSSNQNRAGVAGARGDTAAADAAVALGVTKCADGSFSDGRIFSDTMTGDTFRLAWADFFSAIMAPELLGDLNGASSSTATGVTVSIKIKLANNQVVAAESKLAIAVKDSFVGQKSPETGELINVLKADFTSAQSGSWNVTNGTGNFTLNFADEYGTVTLTGTVKGQTATGTVSFKNLKHHDGQSAAKSGNLGNFSINSCGLLN